MATEIPAPPNDPVSTVSTPPGTMSGRPSPRPRRVSRTGTLVFFVGLLLVGTGDLLLAYLILATVATPPFSSAIYAHPELYSGLGATLNLAGVLLAGAGWILDQDAIARATTESGTFARGPLWTAGIVIVCLGLVCVAAGSGFTAFLAFSVYLNALYVLGEYTGVTFEFLLALGVFLVAVGWLLQHTARLRRIELRST